MIEAGEIAGISVPFTLGVLSAVLPAPPEDALHWYALACSAALAALFFTCVITRRYDRTLASLLFFLVGAFCGISGGLFPMESATHPALVRAMDSFAGHIRSMEWSEMTSNLLTALLTGDRRFIPKETVQSFRDAGAAHILALSGLHLGVLASFLRRLLSPIGNSRAAAAARSAIVIICAGIYACLCGMGPSIQRAFYFLTFREIASHYHGRRFSGTDLLCLSAMLQLSLNPLSAGELSFQLSYLSVAAIILLNPYLERFYPGDGQRFNPMRKIWSLLTASISCQAFTAPLVWAKFGTLPAYFLLTNLIAIPLTEVLLPLALASVALDTAGICPVWLTDICEKIAGLMVGSIETVSRI